MGVDLFPLYPCGDTWLGHHLADIPAADLLPFQIEEEVAPGGLATRPGLQVGLDKLHVGLTQPDDPLLVALTKDSGSA